MRRVDVVLLALFFAVIVGGWFLSNPRRRLTQTEDSEVYNAALIPVLRESEKSAPKKPYPDYIFLSSEYLSTQRPSFESLLDEAIRLAGRSSFTEELLDLRVAARDKSRLHEPVDVPEKPLVKLDLDERIVVGKTSATTSSRIRNRVGVFGEIQLRFFVHLPAYSPDGRTAIVKAKVHQRDNTRDMYLTVLEKKDGKWKMKHQIYTLPIRSR